MNANAILLIKTAYKIRQIRYAKPNLNARDKRTQNDILPAAQQLLRSYVAVGSLAPADFCFLAMVYHFLVCFQG